MKLAVATAVMFAGATVWSLVATPWVAPAFALLTASQLCSLRLQTAMSDSATALRLIYARMALMYVGFAWLLGCFVGRPDTIAFWAVFGTVCVIVAPILTVMWRSVGPAGR